MNIGIYLKLIAPEAGGGYTWIDELMKALQEASQGGRHTFFLLCQGKGVVPLAESETVKIVPLGNLFWRRFFTELSVTHAGQDLQFLLRTNHSMIAPRILRRHGIDMVWFPTGSLFGRVDVPYIATMWDSQHRLQPWFPEVSAKAEWIVRERHYELFLRQAAYVLAGNEASREEVERFYGIDPSRIRLLPHPVPQFARDARDIADTPVVKNLSLPHPYIFSPAQLWPHKNHHAILKALHLLKTEHGLSLTAIFTGSNKGNRTYVEELAQEYHVADQVHLLGFVSRNDLITLYRNAFALVVPSFFGPENFPPLEAFAIGCPVIAADVHGAREQYGNAALLFDPKNAGALAAHLAALHRDRRLRTNLIGKGKKRSGQWTSREYVNGMMDIFDEFASVRRAWPPMQH